MSEEIADVAPPDAGDDHVPDPRRWRILAVVLLVGFMSLLDVTIVGPADRDAGRRRCRGRHCQGRPSVKRSIFCVPPSAANASTMMASE